MANNKKNVVAKKVSKPKKVAPPPPTRLEKVGSILNSAKGYDPNGRSYYNGRYNPYASFCSGDMSVNVESLIKDSIKGSTDKIWNYCVDRVFRSLKIFDFNSWDKQNYTGYYEEIYTEVNLSYSKANQVIDVLTEIDTLSDCDKIKKILELEYGYLLPMLEHKTKVSIADNVIKDKLHLSENYMKKISKEDIEMYKNYAMPVAICVRRHEATTTNGYSVIDGYHRTLAAQQNQKIKNVSIILME